MLTLPLLQVDLFLTELERRLDALEHYGNLKLDAGIHRAYTTLDAVRQACGAVSGELMDAGRRRARVVVDILESRYHDALATRETLEAKASAGLHLMESFLAEFEARSHAVRDAAAAQSAAVVDSGWRRAEEGLKTARATVDDGLERARHAKEALRRSIERAVASARERGLIDFDELPTPWRGNPFIRRGYRFSESARDCVASAFLRLSNETFNIWSHALGLLVIAALAFYVYPASGNFPLSTNADVLLTALFFGAAAKCLVCSTLWHTMNSIADVALMRRFACIDYTGISLLVAASIMTTEYAAFYCEPASRAAYLLATAALGLAGTILPWHPAFNRADRAWARVAFYVTLGATGFAPVVQLCWTRGPRWVGYFYAPVLKSIAVYVAGAVLYAARLPEKLLPGAFDYVGCSHNIWHVAVVCGIVFHYGAMYEMFAGAFQRAESECVVAAPSAVAGGQRWGL